MVRLKVFGQKSKAIPPGMPISFRAVDASRCAILWGGYWWRFNQVPNPEVLPPDEFEEEELDADNRAFKQLGKTVGTVMVVLLLAVKFLFHAPPEAAKKDKVDVEIKKAHLLPPNMKKPEPPKPKPPEPPKPKPKPEPPKPKPPEPPKPKPKPPEPPKPKPKPEPPKPQPKKIEPLKPQPPKAKIEPPKPVPKLTLTPPKPTPPL